MRAGEPVRAKTRVDRLRSSAQRVDGGMIGGQAACHLGTRGNGAVADGVRLVLDDRARHGTAVRASADSVRYLSSGAIPQSGRAPGIERRRHAQ